MHTTMSVKCNGQAAQMRTPQSCTEMFRKDTGSISP